EMVARRARIVRESESPGSDKDPKAEQEVDPFLPFREGRECCDRNQRDQRAHDPGVPAGCAAGEAVEPRRREQPCAEDQVDHVDERPIAPFLHDGHLLYEGRPPVSQTPFLISGESGIFFQAGACAMRKGPRLLTAARELVWPPRIY